MSFLAGGLSGAASPAVAAEFSWFDAVSGSFQTPGRWYYPEEGTLFPISIRNPNPNNRLPGAGDSVTFARNGVDDSQRNGVAYEVAIESAAVGSMNDMAARPGTMQPLTLHVAGTLSAGSFQLSGGIAFSGGQVVGPGVANQLSDTTFRSGVRGVFNVVTGNVILDENASLRATRLNSTGNTRVRGGSVLETDAAAFRLGSFDEVSAGSAFRARNLHLEEGPQPMRVTSGSQLVVDDTLGMGLPNLGAKLEVAGTGSKATISSLNLIGGAEITSTDRAEVVINKISGSGSATLRAMTTDSRLRVQSPLLLMSGLALVTDGGIFTVPEVSVGNLGRITVGKGLQHLSGSRFDSGAHDDWPERIIGPGDRFRGRRRPGQRGLCLHWTVQHGKFDDGGCGRWRNGSF